MSWLHMFSGRWFCGLGRVGYCHVLCGVFVCVFGFCAWFDNRRGVMTACGWAHEEGDVSRCDVVIVLAI